MKTDDKAIVGIHLDLKYLMPRKAYLLAWVRELPELGINTLLLEYEDKFPYRKYPFLQVKDAFTPDEVRQLLDTAHEAGLRVIPLVQTISHLEFALGHPQLAHLREAPEIPTQICPSHPDAVAFVHDLLDEVLAYHDDDEWIHLGADEAWFLGHCETCSKRAGNDKVGLWMEHTRGMCEYVMQRGKRPMVWDDTFWKAPDRLGELPDDVMLCAWNYGVTKLGGDNGLARQAEIYVRDGRDVMGCPCCNWGVLFPRHETLANAAAHTHVVHAKHLRGVINTAWTVFLLPLPVFRMQVAATGALMRKACDRITVEWEADFLEEQFGVDCAAVPDALRNLGELWEVPVEGLGRPLTPPLFGCMDMVLHYPGGQEERSRRGQYPLELNDVDFDDIHRKKIDTLRAIPDRSSLLTKLDAFLDTYTHSAAILRTLADTAVNRREEALLLAALGELKMRSVFALDYRLRGRGTPDTLRQQLHACGEELRLRLAPFLEPASVDRFLRIVWHPQMTALAEKGKCP